MAAIPNEPRYSPTGKANATAIPPPVPKPWNPYHSDRTVSPPIHGTPSRNAINADKYLGPFVPSGNPLDNLRKNVNAADMALGTARGKALKAKARAAQGAGSRGNTGGFRGQGQDVAGAVTSPAKPKPIGKRNSTAAFTGTDTTPAKARKKGKAQSSTVAAPSAYAPPPGDATTTAGTTPGAGSTGGGLDIAGYLAAMSKAYPMMSPADMLKAAATMASDALAPGQLAINQDRAWEQKQYGDQIATSQAAAEAQAKLLGGLAPAVQGAYQNAGDAVAGYARGISGQVGADAQASAQAQADYLTKLGVSPEAAQALLKAQSVGSDLGGAVDYLHGFLPAQDLAGQGAAQYAAAAARPGQALQAGATNIAGINAKANDSYHLLDNKLADLMAQTPGIRQTALTQLQNYNQRNQIARQTGLNQAITANQRQQSLDQVANYEGQRTAIAKRGQDIQVWKTQITATQAAQRIAQADTRMKQSYGVALGRLGIADKNAQRAGRAMELRVYQASQKSAEAQKWLGMGATRYSTILQSAGGAGDAMFAGKFDNKGRQTHPPLSFGQALNEMRANGIPVQMAVPILYSHYSVGVNPDGLDKNDKGAARPNISAQELVSRILGRPAGLALPTGVQ